MLIDFYALSGLINGTLAFILGLFVYSRNPSDRRYLPYGIFCLNLFIWGFAYFFWLTSSAESQALFWARVLMVGAIFLPVTAYHHVIQLIDINTKEKFRLAEVGYLLTILLLLLSPTPHLVSSVSSKLSFQYWPNPGLAFHLHILLFVFFAYKTVHELYQAHAASMGRRRVHLRILLVTITIAYLGGGTNYFLWYDIAIPPVGNILISVYIMVFAYAIIAYRLMDIEVFIKKSLTYAFLLLVLILPCYLLVVWGQKWLFGEVSYLFSSMTLVLFMIVGFLFPKFSIQTEEAFERVLFKKRYNYRETLLRSSKDMLSMVDLDTLSETLIQTVSKTLGTERASLFLSDDEKGALRLQASVGLEQDQFKGFAIRKDDPFVQGLMDSPEALIRDDLEMARNGSKPRQLAEKMGQMQAEVTLPLLSRDRLIGILNLGHKENKEMYSTEDLEVLSTLANQAAVAIENAQLYENLKQSQTIIQRSARLSSLGMLTAGLAHEIRNPLVAIRTFTQLLPERYGDPEFRDTFKTLALKEVDRICGLVNDLLSFARPSTPKVSPEDVNEIVESISRILETEAKEKDVRLHLRLASGLPKIFIDKEQIKQVLMNVIINAIQSIEGGGDVEISTRIFSREGAERFVQIEVRDTGTGIEEEDLENIFNPFFTTKKEGCGLGLSISHQIIQEHAGHMMAESKLGEGTTFFINLPAKLSSRAVNDSPKNNDKDSSR